MQVVMAPVWAGARPAPIPGLFGRAQGPPLPGLYHFFRRGIRGRFQGVVQYACGVQQCAIQQNAVVAFREVALLCEYYAACLIIHRQCCCGCLWEVEAYKRFVYEWVWLVLVQFETYANGCHTRRGPKAKRYIKFTIRNAIRFRFRDAT